MQQGSSSNMNSSLNIEDGTESSPDEELPRTALSEILQEVKGAGTRVENNGARRGKDGESGDAMIPNEEAQENDERGDT